MKTSRTEIFFQQKFRFLGSSHGFYFREENGVWDEQFLFLVLLDSMESTTAFPEKNVL